MSKRKKIKRLSSKKKKSSQSRVLKRLDRLHLEKVENFAGFALETAKPGEMLKVQTYGALISDDPLFYTYIDQISSIFLKNILVNSIYQFLVIIHDNLTADVYYNEIPIKILMLSKRPLKKGEMVFSNDIADIKDLVFENIKIAETDKIIYCFKVGWKFGLYFDLHRENNPLIIKKAQLELGAMYRYLSFQYVYDIIDSELNFDALLSDGWFPFIELLGSEFKEISEAYKIEPPSFERANSIVEKFNKERIGKISLKWWKNPIFSEKKLIIETALNAYVQNSKEGFITCIKIVLTELEGILRHNLFNETGQGKGVHVRDLLNHILDKGKDKTRSELSLFLPRYFLKYLEKSVFAQFDIEAGVLTLSRHTSSHGVAKAEDYTKCRALQMILILDQIYFFL